MFIDSKENAVTIKENNGYLDIIVINESILKIVYHLNMDFKANESLCVDCNRPLFNSWSSEESREFLSVSTEKIKVIYSKREKSLIFYDIKSGHEILKEKSRTLTNAIVEGENTLNIEQFFYSPEDEIISGFGQQQDGLINYKGTFLHLSQYNTINAVPVMVSNKGYGLLWDNNSLTEVNRCKEELKLLYNPYVKSWTGELVAKEDGEYTFIFEKQNRNNGNENISVQVGDKNVIERKTAWEANYIQGKTNLKKGESYEVILNGSGRLYYQLPSMSEYTSIWSECAESINYYFIYGPEIDLVIDGYRKLTGKAPMFPKSAYGFWQSRERYKTGDELIEVVDEYRKRRHPIDNIVQDWLYWRDYGWNALKFYPDYASDMKSIITALHDKNVNLMVSVWPNFGNEDKNEAYHEFLDKGYLMDDSVIEKYMGKYSGALQGYQRNYYDPFNTEARNLLWKRMKEGLFDLGVDAWWLDGSEPNLASMQGMYHLYKTCKGSAAKNLNAYSLMHSKGIYENQRQCSENKRVFILSRTGFTGQQKYASAVWNGDTYCSWEVFKRQIPAGINYCLSGLPYWGTDIGGFSGGNNSDPDFREMYIRWFQFGTFTPIFRAHGTGSYREIWQFGEEAENIMHDYLVLRYRLIPYIYSFAWKVTKENYTLLRGLIMDFREDKGALVITDQYMFGDFLVCPVTDKSVKSRMLYLPKCSGWYDFWTGEYYSSEQEIEAIAPLDTIPLFVRAGSIIFIGPEIQFTNENKAEPLEIRVYCGDDAEFTLYEDEGDSYKYEEGIFSEIDISWNEALRELKIGHRRGEFPGMEESRLFRIVLIDRNTPLIGTDFKCKGIEVVYEGMEIIIRN